MANTCFILLLVILGASDFVMVKAKLCEKPSKTWFGECKDTVMCDKRCIEWEGADHGSCHQREAKYMCFCYMQCRLKDKSPSPSKGGKLSPPGGTGEPSPPGGGQPPPSVPDSGQQPVPPSSRGGQSPPPVGGQPAPPPNSGTPAPSPEGAQSPPPGGRQSAPPPSSRTPAPSPGGGQPTPPVGGQPSPPSDGGKPTPPPGCNRLYIDKLIAEALSKRKIDPSLEKVSSLRYDHHP